MKIALFPGTFDPITIGHVDIINRSLNIFDKIVIGIGKNANKKPMYSEDKRIAWIKKIYKNEPKIEAAVYEGLTVSFCKDINAQYIIRGIRFVSDFEYEKTIADMNRKLDESIETVFLTCLPAYSFVASTLVRDVLRNNGDAAFFLPSEVCDDIQKTPL